MNKFFGTHSVFMQAIPNFFCIVNRPKVFMLNPGDSGLRTPVGKGGRAVLSLSAGCRRNSPAEKAAITGWIFGR